MNFGPKYILLLVLKNNIDANSIIAMKLILNKNQIPKEVLI